MHIKAQCYSQYELNMITVGAAVERKPPTELLLALLKCPTQNAEYLLHHRDLQTLSPHEWLCGECKARLDRPNDGSRSAGEGLCVLQSFLFTTQQD